MSGNSKEVDPSDRDVWRSNLRFLVHAACHQLPGGDPTDVDDDPAPAAAADENLI